MSPARTVLIVEDEDKIAQVLDDYLARSGFTTQRVADGLEAVSVIRARAPDLVLLDLMIPGQDGLEVCREVRTFSAVPIIMVTARVEEIDRLLGLELGADDYVCKPFSPREVVARVKTVLRRVDLLRAPGGPPLLFQLDAQTQSASVAGEVLTLTRTEFRLLEAFVARPGRVFSRAELLDRVHDDGRDVFDRAIDSHVKNLRRKIARVLHDQEPIQSVYGVGYKLEP